MPEPTLADVLAATLALHKDVRRLLNRDGRGDALLGPFLAATHGFGGSSCWSTGELIQDAQQSRRHDLLDIIDQITAGADPARSLGKFCRRCEGITVDGLRLDRAKKLWAVSAV